MLICNKVTRFHGNYSVGGMPKITNQIPAIGKALANKSQRALLMCKPDAVVRGLAPQIINDVSLKLIDKGINHRIVAPKIFQMTPALAQIFYDNVRREHGDILFDRVTQYASGTHPDPRVPQAPMVAFIVEAQIKEGEDLIKILRADDFIGPTRIKTEKLTEQIMKSLRFKYTLEKGFEQKPFEESPVMNCIHCSSSAGDANKEISTIYLKEELNPYYRPDALDVICQEPINEIRAIRNKSLSVPIQNIAEMTLDRYKEYVTRLAYHFKYRDFDVKRLLHVHDIAKNILQVTLDTGKAYFKSLAYSITGHFISTGAACIRLKKIMGVSGFTGSGKSSAIRTLVDKGDFERLLLITTRPPRQGEIHGKDYTFVTGWEFADMLSKEKFVACEEINGEIYGILRETIDDAVLGNKDLVFAGGPNMINDIKAYLSKAELLNKAVRFSSVMIHLPGKTVEEKKNNVISHIKDRSDANERASMLTDETIRRYESFAPGYDLIIESAEGKSEEAASQILKHALVLDNLPLTDYADPPERATHWERIIVGSRLKTLLAQIERIADESKGKELQEIEDRLKEVNDNLAHFFLSIKRVVDPSADESPDKIRLAALSNHTSAVVASLLQLSGDHVTIMKSEKRFGKLPLLCNAPRAKLNIEQIKATENCIDMNNKMSMALLHDIGKLIEMARHPENSYALLQRLALYRWLREVSMENKKMNEMTILYHTILGSSFKGNSSYAEFHDMFSNPAVKELLSAEEGKVNLQAVQQFLSSLLLITFIDVAGSGDATGALTNSKVEAFLGTAERLFEIFKSKRHSYTEALKDIEADIPKHNLERIGLIIGTADIYMDSKADPIESYKKMVTDRANNAIKRGVFSEDEWAAVIKHFHLLRAAPYSTLNLTTRVLPEKNEIIKGMNENFTDSILKLLVVLSGILQRDPSQYAELTFLDSNGKDMVNMGRERSAAVELNKVLSNASVKTIARDGKICLEANDGSIIDNLRILTRPKEDGKLEISIQFLGI